MRPRRTSTARLLTSTRPAHTGTRTNSLGLGQPAVLCGRPACPDHCAETYPHIMVEPPQDRAPTSVADNIDKMAQVENDALRPRSHREAITEAIGGFAGTIYFVVLQLAGSGAWMLVNAEMEPGLSPFDPFPYPLLSAITSFEAVLLAAFVLIKQNRMSTVADRRDHLDLQVNLLTERETTRIIQMLDRLSSHFGVEQYHDADSRDMGRHIAVEHLLDELDRRMPDSKA
jgi:uncharacterized membrane protein